MSSAHRQSPYTLPYKAIRAMLGALTEQAGRTDFTEPVEVAGLRGAIRATLAMLEARGALEDRVLGPALRKHAPASALEIVSAHAELRSRGRRLLAAMNEAEFRRDAAPHAVVVAISRFAADFASHLADVEEIAVPALVRAIGEDGLARLRDELERAAPAEERLAWLRWTLPAVTHGERVELLRAMRVERAIYADAVAIARAILPDEARERLEIALSLPPPARAA